MKIRISGFNKESIVDGTGLRYTIYTQGCKHNCKGCHNPETHSFVGGEEVRIDQIYEDIINNPLLKGVTFSGGDPVEQPTAILELAKKIKENTKLDIWLYTGYTLEQLRQSNNNEVLQLLDFIDVLVDGKFEEDGKDMTLKFRGSSNQRIIELKG